MSISTGSWKKQESSRKKIYFCFIDCAKAFDCVDHNKLCKILQEMGIPDHLTCLLRNLYASQEATEPDMEQGLVPYWEKGICQGCIRRRQWHSTPVLLPGKSHGWRSLVGCSPWGRKVLDVTKQLPFHFSLPCIGGGNGNPFQCSCLENPRDGGAWWAAFYGVTQSWT